MRRHTAILGMLWLALAGSSARAQAPAAATGSAYDDFAARVYGAPGNYGMMYGTASYGSVRTYSAYSSPYSPGYAQGYAPATILPGAFGTGLWGGPSASWPSYPYGTGFYRTFQVPFGSVPNGPLAPVGAYAPGFGPPSYSEARKDWPR